MDTRPIGFFDSSIGGLTILAAARRLLPNERMVYLADTACFPYGALPVATLRQRAAALVQFLLERRCKLIVVACNTATVHALAHLRAAFPGVPFVGVVPVVKMLAERTRSGIIALLSTPATAQSDYLSDLVKRFAAGCRVINVACPGLAELIESAPAGDPAIAAQLETYLAPIQASGADVVGLGCTHYPLIRPQIRRALGPGVRVYDSSLPVARRIRSVLTERDALFPAGEGSIALFSTRDAGRLTAAARRLLPASHATARTTCLDSREGPPERCIENHHEPREMPWQVDDKLVLGTHGDPGAGSCCYTTDRADSRRGAGLEAGTGHSNTERCAR